MWIDRDRRATKFFETIPAKEKKPADMMHQHKELVREMVRLKKRIKDPVNMKNGEPLAETTVNNFIRDVESIRAELRRYQVIIKWLRICDFWREYKWKSELSPEQEFLKIELWSHIRHEKELSTLKEKLRNSVNSEAARYWMFFAQFLTGVLIERTGKPRERIFEMWSETVLDVGDDGMKRIHQEEIQRRNRKTYKKVNGGRKAQVFKLIPGGKKFEDDPPFAPQNPS